MVKIQKGTIINYFKYYEFFLIINFIKSIENLVLILFLSDKIKILNFNHNKIALLSSYLN